MGNDTFPLKKYLIAREKVEIFSECTRYKRIHPYLVFL
jgi:hypothetical protein